MPSLEDLRKAAAVLAHLLPLETTDDDFGEIHTGRGEHLCECCDFDKDRDHDDDPSVPEGWSHNAGVDVAKAAVVAMNALPKLLALAKAAKDSVAHHEGGCSPCGVGQCDICYALRALNEETPDAHE